MSSDDGQSVSLGRLLGLARAEWRILSIATVSLFIASSVSLAYPQGVKYLVDSALTEGDSRAMDEAAGILLVLFFVAAIFAGLRSWLFTIAGERIVANLRGDLFSALTRQDVAFFDQSRTGGLTNRLTADTAVLQNAVTVNVSMVLRYGIGALGGLVALVWMSPRLAGMTLVLVPVVAFSASKIGRKLRGISRGVQDALASANEVAEEVISGIRTVRSFGAEEQEVRRYRERIGVAFGLAKHRAALLGVFNAVIGFTGYVTVGLVVWWGGKMVMADAMSIGDLTAFLLYTGLVAMSVGALAGLYSDFMAASGASQRVFELLDATPTIENQQGAQLSSVQGHVKFSSVTFHYPSRPDVPVLKGLDFEIRAGGSVALVGQSGVGKSTVAALLLRLYDPTSGIISLDGEDIRALDPRALRGVIGTVAQEPILFATTILDNIRYAKPRAGLDEVLRVAKAANAHDFVMQFPEGYDTLVGERGVRLSGGQKQRIAIARALLADPPLLILDEATSALDAESEGLVQEALERLMEGRTTIIIAHRLSTVRTAGEVLVLQEGMVAERGSHDALLASDGVYRRLVARQFGGEAPRAVAGLGEHTLQHEEEDRS
jgi:ABC-type multidrug transport system fused ATPase/permease subunit